MIHWCFGVLLTLATICGCKAVWSLCIGDSFSVYVYACLVATLLLGMLTLLPRDRDGDGKGGSYA